MSTDHATFSSEHPEFPGESDAERYIRQAHEIMLIKQERWLRLSVQMTVEKAHDESFVTELSNARQDWMDACGAVGRAYDRLVQEKKTRLANRKTSQFSQHPPRLIAVMLNTEGSVGAIDWRDLGADFPRYEGESTYYLIEVPNTLSVGEITETLEDFLGSFDLPEDWDVLQSHKLYN